MDCLELVAYFDQEINRVLLPTFLQQLTIGSSFNQGLAGAARPTTLQCIIIVGDDFERTLLTESLITQGRGYRWFCPVCRSNFEVLLVELCSTVFRASVVLGNEIRFTGSV